MKLASTVIAGLLLAEKATAFAPHSMVQSKARSNTRNSQRFMAMDMEAPAPPAETTSSVPAITQNAYGQPTEVRYSDFLKLVDGDKIEKVTFSADGTQLLGVDVDGARIRIEALPNDPELLTSLTNHKVDVTVLPQQEASGLGELAQSLIFPAALFAGLFFLSRRGGAGGGMGGPGNPMGFGKSKAEIQMVPDTGVTFDDVAGCDGAKLELSEVVDFLKQPEAYTKNGCKIPRGVILDGPPGTGKTLLAKAVAGEAGVPFISISGSEFVEMFVGVGASRVRDIFSQARKNAPCIIFIDEIDAVGRQRGAGYAGGNDEREQTVNQILVEMDGFDGNPGIITIAATNRVDILDQALLRPGRFDRKVTVDLPDFKGRTRILGVHSRGKPLEPDVDLEAISRRTPGFSGAQLENLMNEAAIAAARAEKSTIGWEQIDGAVDRIMVGLEKKGGNPQLKQKELVAYHEAGHAIVGALVPDYDQVQKITIIPRSNGAGGLTFFAPQESRLESGMYSKQYLESQLAVALGGRLAEEIIYGEDFVTTGASNDIQQVANIAKRMVKEWGMSDKVGRVAVSEPSGGGPFMGQMMLRRPTQWGNKLMGTIEEEVERLVNNSYLVAKKILSENKDLLDHLANVLMEQEVVSAEEFQMMLVQFKAQTIDYKILGQDKNRESLPFQNMPSSV
ncbi:zinc metalloprotease FTSH, chloroplastic [Seminavis robusta]|uniref:Zinc metalloprotease FTSH, chloroplastic n=1 Tax=Seminavis robusta TaxID=568900 RepID=A0A9N8E900_9STRA|nr:zinc metalloprotease FTSH, chloroplastic [Seminavis robusta]|eukprot:Sro758_g198040.1 zinc metalloprotease FTSH, chloroplastic (677) ;mRNA; r:18781-21012